MSDAKRPDRMPVLVVSGFLGAGKTTFLNQLLSTPALADSLVIVNEFGDAGLDSLFLEEEAQASGSGLLVEELTSGCLCCTLQGPLISTLEDLLRARDNGRIKPFKQLIIETTGLADPAPILGAFAKHPYLALRYLVGGIVTVVDAAQDLSALDQTPEATAQIAVADVLAISKSDLVDAGETEKLAKQLELRNSHAQIALAPQLAEDTAWVTQLLEQAVVLPSLPASDASGQQEHSHDHAHDHHHQHAYSVVLRHTGEMEQRIVTMFMDLVGMNLPGDVLRVKGIVWIANNEGPKAHATPWAIHAAGPLQHPPRPIRDGIAAKLETDENQVVVITRTDQTQRLRELFAACLKQNHA
ncbi:MAG: GTP-binding protein [Devosiaceae bacterium]